MSAPKSNAEMFFISINERAGNCGFSFQEKLTEVVGDTVGGCNGRAGRVFSGLRAVRFAQLNKFQEPHFVHFLT